MLAPSLSWKETK
ncbi:unnamed protein product [Debaryomyces fabryi]|nr:unnamed protein product [Debaryomyces fabryi]